MSLQDRSGEGAGPSLKARALQHLARREHGRTELARKLAEHAPDAPALEALLDALQAQGWLSDERYAASWVRSRAARLGDRRLQAELQAKGVDASVAAEALAEAGCDEMARAQAYWAKKFGQPPLTLQERAKQQRHLLGRGFSPEVVRAVVPRT
jgi:regulatory protein